MATCPKVRGHLNLRDVTLRNCTLVNVSIHRTNLGTTRFIGCNARDVLLVEPRVKVGSTRLELKGLRVPAEVLGVRELKNEGSTTFYAPKSIMRILGECGAPVETKTEDDMRNVAPVWLDLLERMIRAYQKANPICDGDQNLRHLFEDSRWPVLRDLLIEHGIVNLENRPASGRPKEFLRRRFSPDEIMSGASKTGNAKPQIVRFWDALEAKHLKPRSPESSWRRD